MRRPLRRMADRVNEGLVPRVAEENREKPRPVVKWAGGKSKLVDKLLEWMPEKIDTYVEPFCGGAAVFFALAAKRGFKRAILNDRNAELVACYSAIKSEPETLVARLRRYEKEYFRLTEEKRAEYYYAVRANHHETKDVERGARLLFLNKTCFNGLWRVNASGKFNVPFGRYDHPKVLDEDVIRAAHVALKGVKLRNEDFAKAVGKRKPTDFVYFDPPYVPLSRTANFTAYASDGFGKKDQERLGKLLRDLHVQGVPALLSNARSPETEELYGDFHWRAVPMPRSINSNPGKRGEVEELVVFNIPASKSAKGWLRTGT